jgi:hypothetical protein
LIGRREAEVHLRRAHEHRTAVDVVLRALGLLEVALQELGVTLALAVRLFHGLRRLGVPGGELEQAQVGDFGAVFVEQLLPQDPRLDFDELAFTVRARRGRDRHLEQRRDREPLATFGMFFSSRVEETRKLFRREISRGLFYGERELLEARFGIRLSLDFAEESSDRLRIHFHPSE